MKKEYWLAVTLLVGMTACSNDETENVVNGDSAAALFTGSIEATHTRAFDQVWEIGDQIGISGITGDKTYTNIPYNYVGSSNETFTAAAEEIYYQNNADVTFTAYYPWNTNLTENTTISTDTRGQVDQKTFDFLYAQADGKKNKKVNFNFTHRMAKLVLTIKADVDMEYTDVQGTACSLENFLYEGTFDRTTGMAAANGSPSAMWVFANNAAAGEEAFNTPTISGDESKKSVSYTLILFPQAFPSAAGNLSFAAETGGITYSAEIDLSQVPGNDANELKASTQYNITVNLNKTTGLTVGTSTISPWEEKNYEIDADI